VPAIEDMGNNLANLGESFMARELADSCYNRRMQDMAPARSVNRMCIGYDEPRRLVIRRRLMEAAQERAIACREALLAARWESDPDYHDEG